MQAGLQSMEAESKKLGESHTTARFSLQLEVDRLKRDLERLEDELAARTQGSDEREDQECERTVSWTVYTWKIATLPRSSQWQTQAR